MLAALAEVAQRTVLLSVHQPSSQVFALLDHLTLLADGRALYRGAAADVSAFLARASVPAAPPGTSTADHLLYVCCSHRATMQAAHGANPHAHPHPHPEFLTLGFTFWNE